MNKVKDFFKKLFHIRFQLFCIEITKWITIEAGWFPGNDTMLFRFSIFEPCGSWDDITLFSLNILKFSFSIMWSSQR